MQRASTLFSDQQKKQVAQAVAQAEAATSAEIVPVVATASGRYDRAEDIVGLWVGLVAMIVVYEVLPHPAAEPGSWGGPPTWLKLVLLAAAVVAGFIAGALTAMRAAWLRRLLAPRREMADEVLRQAQHVFFDSRVHHTAGRTGVLIYISLFERMAAVIADQAVLDKLGQPALAEMRDHLVEALKTQPTADALCAAIQAAGQRLAPVLPRQVDDVNELSDALVTID